MKHRIITITILTLTLMLTGCRLPWNRPNPGDSFRSNKEAVGEFVPGGDKAMFVLNRADDLFFVLVIAAVCSLALGIWARAAIGFYVAAACGSGAVLLLVLAQFSTYIGYGLIGLALMVIVYFAVRWRQTADSAIAYADSLKRHVPKDAIESVNTAASALQNRAVRKYIDRRRSVTNGGGE